MVGNHVSLIFLRAFSLKKTCLFSILFLSSFAAFGSDSAVYVQSNASSGNKIAWLSLAGDTGKLFFQGEYSTRGTGDQSINGNQAHALASNGKYLFVTNAGDDSISVFKIQTSGQPYYVDKYPSLGGHPVSLAFFNNNLIVLNQGDQLDTSRPASVQSFNVSSYGKLTSSKGRYTYPSNYIPVDIVSTPSAKSIAIALSGVDQIDFFKVLKNNQLARTHSLSGINNPLGGAMGRLNNKRMAFTLVSDPPGVASLGLNKDGSPLSVVQDIRPYLQDPCWAVATSNGRYLWLSSFKTRILSLYRWGAMGTLSHLDDAVHDLAGPGGLDLALSADNRYLFRLRVDNVVDDTIPTRPGIDTFVVRLSAPIFNAGLKLIDQTNLPESWAEGKPTGILTLKLNKLP